ncbi:MULTISPECIES: DUF4123 domain-containing protein [Yersinia]|uniref:DUF4123 domain-containing protein n=1 Tax=Yersinia TaxID=629 RepID=UPI0005E66012|nr:MULTISPECIES: DUF4123 domain-containing protein [Yersinia]ARB86782.2 DUF4123 domain-containing protein [Yersinia sp. FDAARGOS_228]AVL35376.1 DUF4123 domain-containing protein [Yersinia intermedia]CND88451.1 Uncharacterised protein [Yersinia intermedia]
MNISAYDFIMRELMTRPDCSLFALVDGLQYERYFGEEIQNEKGVVVPFLNIWPDSRIAFAGPWLYRLNASEHHREQLKQLSEFLPAVSWIISRGSLEDLAIHFKPFLTLQLPDGRCAFFRFYDPRILAEIELLLNEPDYGQFVRGVEEWVFQADGGMVNVKDKASYYL